ncbi:hypothetical protein ASG31_08390 [Chryseobacterium sp. Leaf404]|uniref:P22 phage major capsid protein family protein n=1 Tax=unclassified Chryseobacterium TaxID=2593645 RepID=UPI0006F96F47|nr:MULTISPECIES: phage capsid protein [unclassified Chryseobacterium]KQT17419.1 hypothetical protein ASG31_08390 [Chryseobacterium sp. Leaf404]
MAQNPKVPQELWASYVVEKLWKENPHLALCYDESAFVKGGSVVYIPQAGAKPATQKNRNVYPATATKRADTALVYALDVWTTDPSHLPLAEQLELSYEKTDSVLGDHVNTLIEAVGDELIYNWVRAFKPAVNGGVTADNLPANKKIPTSGAATAVNGEDGQTGTRKALHYKDIQKAQAMMNKDNVAKTERYAMLESYMYQQFLDSLSDNQMAAFAGSADLEKGIVGTFAGFKILDRSSVLAFTTAGVAVMPGEALSATDNLGCLFWQKNSVTKAMGDTEMFDDKGNPLYYGDIFSTLLKMGGRCRREDWKGVLAVVQAS